MWRKDKGWRQDRLNPKSLAPIHLSVDRQGKNRIIAASGLLVAGCKQKVQVTFDAENEDQSRGGETV